MSGNNSSTLDLSTNYQYIVSGSLALVFNVTILFILVRNISLFKKSAFVIGLAVGDMLDAIALLGNGVTRILRAYNLLSSGMIHPFDCMIGKGLTPIFLMGNQIPGVMFLLIGLERYVAIHYFDWYYLKWSNKLAWKCTLCAYLYCAVSLLAAYVATYLMSASTKVSASCPTPNVMGSNYITYNYMVSIVGGAIAVVMTLIAMVLFTRRRNKMISVASVSSGFQNHLKTQWYLTRIMLCIAILDVGLVVIPSILLVFSNGLGLITIRNIGTWSLQVICSRSVLNIVIYILINAEFRNAFLKAFGMRRLQTAVKPLTDATTMVVQNHKAETRF